MRAKRQKGGSTELDPPLKVRGLSKIGRLHGVRIACVKAGKVWYEFHVYISVPEWDRRG